MSGLVRSRWARRLLPITLGLMLTSVFATPAAAYSYDSTGLLGEWSFNESYESPIARCGYSREYAPNSAFLRWMKVMPPTVYAADRNSDKIDSKRVVWFFKLQKSKIGESTWKTVATSAKQSDVAYENEAASFSALRIDYNTGTKFGTGHIYRALIVIKFVKKDGTVEGRVKVLPTYYRLKLPWYTITGSKEWCQREQTSG